MAKRRPTTPTTTTCPVCGQIRRASELVPGEFVRERVTAEIQRDHAEWTGDSVICATCLNRYRAEHVRRLLEEEKGELTVLDSEVIRSLREQDSISADVNARLRSEYDYRVNLKAELEIRLLHAKLDQLLTHQWERLLEIQQLQIDRVHSFRHYFCSTCANNGVPERMVMDWLGHADSEMIRHYYHLHDSTTRRRSVG